MKKIFALLVVSLFANTLFAQTAVHNFEQLMTALIEGKSVKAFCFI